MPTLTVTRARRAPFLLLLPILGLGLGGCTSASTATPTSEDGGAGTVVVTTTQLGSITGDIATCAGGTATTLMGPGDDPHEFAVSSAQVADLVKADLVVANGLGLEQNLESSLANAVEDGATLYEVAPDLHPLSYADLEAADDHHAHEEDHADETHSDDEHADEHHHGTYDPHVFLDAGRMAEAAELIGQHVTKATGHDAWTSCGTQVADDLRATDTQVRDILSDIPDGKRVLITDHEAYNYFADTYDFEVAGVVIPGGGTDAQPSSAELADLVSVIHHENIHVLFSNNALSPQLLEALASEAGGDVTVVALYTGSLGEPGSEADTYSKMMLTNANLIADALA